VLTAAMACAALMPLLQRLAPGWGVGTPAAAALPVVGAVEHERLIAIWLFGAVAGGVTLAAGLWRLAVRRSRARRSDDERLLAMLVEARVELAVARSVGLFESRTPMMPATWGFLRPLILLPLAARQWSDDRVRAVLRHELAHVRRGDWLVNLLVEVVTRMFWFTPVVWYARRRLRRESERACDDVVVNLGGGAADYATHLLGVAREFRGHAPLGSAALAMAGSGLERRMSALLSGDINRAPITSAAALAIAILLAGFALPIAGFGIPSAPSSPARQTLLDVQRDIMMRLGSEERRFSIVSHDVSFWKNRIEGRVELQARLNVDGSVSGVTLVEPVHPDLASAATVIVRQWRREPARVRGVAVEVPIRMTVDFRK
jgi:TonB family protein